MLERGAFRGYRSFELRLSSLTVASNGESLDGIDRSSRSHEIEARSVIVHATHESCGTEWPGDLARPGCLLMEIGAHSVGRYLW